MKHDSILFRYQLPERNNSDRLINYPTYTQRTFVGPDIPGFLLQPFRKPKRIRTAFSPSQLLKLEHAFEKNHYVVGAERKQLAQSLSLTETQFARAPPHQLSISHVRDYYHNKARFPPCNAQREQMRFAVPTLSFDSSRHLLFSTVLHLFAMNTLIRYITKKIRDVFTLSEINMRTCVAPFSFTLLIARLIKWDGPVSRVGSRPPIRRKGHYTEEEEEEEEEEQKEEKVFKLNNIAMDFLYVAFPVLLIVLSRRFISHCFISNLPLGGHTELTFLLLLYNGLSLSPVPVKVWFQNRRTKHKRMQQEEEAKTSQGGKSGTPNSNNAHHINKWKEETGEDQYGEYIDMDMEDDCISDVESES
ncbi:unnamed protein product [Brassicogethes aeneus]|uniref:Homeobox domain-containing protein n=1 Tax=Brassicogethes aeneus TaxID=1431903 RepID=A0A9P0B5Y4_BRAAE|nr:unnamed protein product [Brassicogethes aeneus]